jgi:hypothetical protein
MKIIAKNKKNQSAVNKAVKFLMRYNENNDLRDKADGDGDEKLYNKFDRICEVAYDNYLEAISELPQTEIKAIEKELY